MDGTSSVLTAIYAPTERLERVVMECLPSTTAEFPDAHKFALCDCVTPGIRDYLVANGWTSVFPEDGQPPRMGRLLRAGFARVITDIVWTIEHDVAIHAGGRAPVEELLRNNPGIAGIEFESLDKQGLPNYPTDKKPRIPYSGSDGLWHIRPSTSLSCVCWRADAWRQLDWSLVPDFPACDKMIGQQLGRKHWAFCIAPAYKCTHLFARARKDLPHGPAR